MWIELHDTAREHPKILKLARDLGQKPVVTLGHVTSLWTWVLRMAPDGCLESFDVEDLELAAQWDGEPGLFISKSIDRKLIDVINGIMYVHDWKDFSGSLKARDRKREQREKKRKENMSQDSHDKSRDVTLNETNERNERTIIVTKQKQKKESFSCEIALILDHYREVWPSRGKHLLADNEKRSSHEDWVRIRRELEAGMTVEDLKLAIDGNKIDEWHRTNGKHSIEYIFRNHGKVEDFINIAKTKQDETETKWVTVNE